VAEPLPLARDPFRAVEADRLSSQRFTHIKNPQQSIEMAIVGTTGDNFVNGHIVLTLNEVNPAL
jgi:hypothetical protein